MSKQVKIMRDLSPSDYPWLERPYVKGEFVYLYAGATYGCVSQDGIAVTEIEDQTPFFEIPWNSIGIDNE